MKKEFILILTMLLAGLSRGQVASFCTDFSDMKQDTGWKANGPSNDPGVTLSIKSSGPSDSRTDYYLEGKDEPNASFVFNDVDFKGNWLLHSGKCLCWNIKVINDGDNQATNQVTPSFSIYVGNPNNPAGATLRAAFYANFKISENDGWKRLCAPISPLDVNGNLPKNSIGEWKMIKGTNADWNDLLSKVEVISYGFDYTKSPSEVYGVDNICLKDCEEIGGSENCGCGNTVNLIKNGKFDNGVSDFKSQFNFSNIKTKSFFPGTFTIADYPGSSELCKNWANAGCGKGDGLFNNFLIINGATGIPGYKSVWSQDVQLKTGKEYKLCMMLRNLPQCCFNVNPKVSITYFDGNKQQTLGPIVVTESACPGQKQTFNISIPQNAIPSITSTISINLDQSDLGDGNDLAIDDISLIELKPLPVSLIDFGESISPVDANGKYTITATAPGLPAGTAFYWEIQDITDPSNPIILSNPSQWWSNPLSTNFNGYNNGTIGNSSVPGIFVANRTYRIVRGTWGDCNSWSAVSHIYKKEINSNKIGVQKDNKYKAVPPQAVNALKN